MGKEETDNEYLPDWESSSSDDDAWVRARSLVLNSEILSEEERTFFKNGSIKSVEEDLFEIEQRYEKGSRFRRFASRIKPLLDGLTSLDAVISPLTNMDPYGVAALVWGGIKIISNAAKAVLRATEDLLNFFSRIGIALSRLQLYEKLTSRPPRLNQVLLSIYIKYLRLCLYLRDSLIKEGGHLRPWKNVYKFGSDAFTKSVTEKISQIDRNCGVAHKEAHLAVSDAILKSATESQRVLQSLSVAEKDRQKAEKEKDLKDSKIRFMAWLEEVPTEAIYQGIHQSQLEGTCEWIENDELISSWMSVGKPNPSLLWISSGPGSGKSTLCAHMVCQLQYQHPTAFFFCRTDDRRTLKTTSILQNWIWQLVRDSPILPESITTPSDEYRSASIMVLTNILIELQQHLKTSYLVVDGLDECVDNKAEFLQSCQSLSKTWNVLIVSRDEPDIRNSLKKSKFNHKVLKTNDNRMDIDKLLIHKVITKKDTKEDIKKIVGKYTQELAKDKAWQAMQNRIADVLNANAEGMFLWVQLVLDFLFDEAIFENDIEDILTNMPSGLNDLYQKILRKIKANDSRWRIAQRALYWVIHGFRPLTVDQIHAAIAFDLDPSIPINGFDEILKNCCGLLLGIDEVSKQVGILHATVKEYLVKTPDIFETSIDGAEFAHGQMSKICIAYLHTQLHSGIHVNGDLSQSEIRVKTRLESDSHKLLEYSVIYWCQHLQKSLQQSKEWEPSLILLFSSENHTTNWLQLFHYLKNKNYPGTNKTVELIRFALNPHLNDSTVKHHFDYEKLGAFKSHLGLATGGRFLRWDRFVQNAEDMPKLFPVILVAAQFDFVNIVKCEIRRRVSVETKSYCGGTILVWAARSGSLNTLQYLLRMETQINDQSLFNQETALAKSVDLEGHIATYHGTYPVTQALLEADANPYLSHRHGWNLLNLLINSHNVDGDEEVSTVKLLLRYGPNLWEHTHPVAGPVLHHAIARNKPRIANAILEEVWAQDLGNASKLLSSCFEGETALHFALQENPNMAPLLLEHGADGNTPDSQRVLPIQFAAQYDLGPAIRALVDRNCNINSKDHWNETPLTIALQNQSMDAVSELINMEAGLQQVHELLVLQPRTTPLDKQIAALKPKDIPWPLSERDIYQICYRLRAKYGFPIPVVARIFDMAEIWVQSSVARNVLQSYDQHTLRKTYIRSAPVRGRSEQPVQKVVFTITSHDQGYCTSDDLGSYTWFEVFHITNQVSLKPWNCRDLVYNRFANLNWETHVVTWTQREQEFLKLVGPADRMSVIARALYPGWINYVKDMRIDVYTSILRNHYKESERDNLYGQLEGMLGFKVQTIKLENTSIHSPEPPELCILSADYGGAQVTHIPSDFIFKKRFLRFNTDRDYLDIHFGDNFPGSEKALTFIYQVNGSEPMVFLTTQHRGLIIIDLMTAGWKAPSFPPSVNAAIHILAIFYGDKLIRDEAIYRELYKAKADGREFPVNDSSLIHTWPGNRKVCVVYFRGEDGSVGRVAAREGEQLRL